MLGEATGLKSLKVDGKARQWQQAVRDAQDRAISSIKHAFEYNKARWDKSHKPVRYNPGDEVRLSPKFLDLVGTQNKLKPAWIGPFKVKAMKGPNAVEVELPSQYRPRHPVFPVVLTELHKGNPDIFSSRRLHTPQYPAVEQDDCGQDLWEIDFFRQERSRRTADGPVKEYLVHWKGWDVSYDSWVPEEDFDADEALEAFKSKVKRKTRRCGSLKQRTLDGTGSSYRLLFLGRADVSPRAPALGFLCLCSYFTLQCNALFSLLDSATMPSLC